MNQISVLRLYLLRGCYLLLVVGLTLTIWPLILSDAAERPLLDGAVNALLGAIGLLAVAGLFSPLRMLPLLIFEVVWKLIWVVSVALPLWLSGRFTAEAGEILFACAWAIPFVLIIPWRYAAREILAQNDRWK